MLDISHHISSAALADQGAVRDVSLKVAGTLLAAIIVLLVRYLDIPLPLPYRWRSRRIRKPDDPAIGRMLEIWSESGIPAHELDDESDVRAWVEEECRREASKLLRLIRRERLGSRLPKFTEYMLVAERGKGGSETLGAALWATHYRTAQLAFISYLGQDKANGVDHGGAAKSLYRRLRFDVRFGALRTSAGLVFELDDPEGLERRRLAGESISAGRIKTARARRRRFIDICSKFGIECRQLVVPYVQPSLDLQRQKPEESMALMLALKRWPLGRPPESLSAADARRVLDFVLHDVYGDSFGESPELHGVSGQEATEYARYLADLEQRILPDSEARVQLRTFDEVPQERRPERNQGA